jgi:AraC-like DNA-binding protein
MVKSNYSNVEEYNFNWVKIMLVGALIIISFDLCLKVYDDITNNLNWELQYFVIAAMVLLISYLGYYGVNQPKVVLPNFLVLEEGTVSANASNNSTTLSNNEAEFKLLRDKLEHILKQFKPHLDEDLTLGKLAHQIPTTDKKLSMLLNQHMNTSFYDLINKYRVEEIKERIKSNTYEKYTLFGIACECGFKSRTSFNRIFKQETGLSPSEYKKKHL